ncbi:MAG: hypothetical protein M3179_00835 [Actinomycetota bacterium]|nr:hypothetical protein [Actinomycetota bacterium]
MTSYASDPPYTDGFDLNVDPPCDNNTWLGNRFGTVNQPCVWSHVASRSATTAPAAVAGTAAEHPLRSPSRPGRRASLY